MVYCYYISLHPERTEFPVIFMKLMEGKLSRLETILALGTIVIFAAILWVWKNTKISTAPDAPLIPPTATPIVVRSPAIADKPVDQMLTPTIPTDDNYLLDNLVKSDNWPFFNQDYQSLYRDFRFRYPPTFEIVDRDNDYVWLRKGNVFYLGIDRNVYLDVAQSSTSAETFEFYYAYRKRQEPALPDLSKVERIDLGRNRFVYKFSENRDTMFFGHPSLFPLLDTWNRYFGIIDGKGIDIFDPKMLPEDVVYEIIRSIEFK